MMAGKEGAHVFVKIEEYKEVLEVVGLIKDKLAEAKQTLATIDKLKQEEDAELHRWNETVQQLEHRVDEVDAMLFEPEGNW